MPAKPEFSFNREDHNEQIDYHIIQSFFKIGYCHMQLRQYNLAIRDFQLTLVLDPTFYDAYFNQSLCYINKEEYSNAYNCLQNYF